MQSRHVFRKNKCEIIESAVDFIDKKKVLSIKDKENNMTKQTLTKAGKALSDIDLDMVSGGLIKVGGDTNSRRGKNNLLQYLKQ